MVTYGYGDEGAPNYTSGKVSFLIGRLDRLTWAGTRVAVYYLNGDGRLQFRQSWKGTGEEDLVAATSYEYDLFERLDKVEASPPEGEQFFEFHRGYDYNGNPCQSIFQHKQTRSELYGTLVGGSPEGPADRLNRLTRFRRGTLNQDGNDLTTTIFEQDWHDTAGNRTLDKLGNWDAVRVNPEGAPPMTTVMRGHNQANEYTSLNASSAYGHDANGNLTDDETYTRRLPSPFQGEGEGEGWGVNGVRCTTPHPNPLPEGERGRDDDFANHLAAAVRQSDGDTIGQYVYDALGRRVKKVVDEVSKMVSGTICAKHPVGPTGKWFLTPFSRIEEGRLDAKGGVSIISLDRIQEAQIPAAVRWLKTRLGSRPNAPVESQGVVSITALQKERRGHPRERRRGRRDGRKSMKPPMNADKHRWGTDSEGVAPAVRTPQGLF